MLDTSIGVFICYLLLAQIKRVPQCLSYKEFGDYGFPPRLSIWLKQTLVWQGVVCCMKLILAILMYSLSSALLWFAATTLRPLTGFPHLKVAFVMIVAPTVMNAFQYWCIDNIIKKRYSRDDEALLLHETLEETNETTNSAAQDDEFFRPASASK